MGVHMNDFNNQDQEPEIYIRSEGNGSILQPCPVAIQAKEVLRASQETAFAMRNLRRTFMECEHCPDFGDCELREEFNRQVDLAIAELLEEWGW
jgi:hypothetical protein